MTSEASTALGDMLEESNCSREGDLYFFLSSVVMSGTEDIPETPRLSAPLRTPGSVFKSSVGGAHSALTAPFTPDVDSPFSSPAIRRLVGQQEPRSPWFGTVQSPHVMRRGPKLWSSSTGEAD